MVYCVPSTELLISIYIFEGHIPIRSLHTYTSVCATNYVYSNILDPDVDRPLLFMIGRSWSDFSTPTTCPKNLKFAFRIWKKGVYFVDQNSLDLSLHFALCTEPAAGSIIDLDLLIFTYMLENYGLPVLSSNRGVQFVRRRCVVYLEEQSIINTTQLSICTRIVRGFRKCHGWWEFLHIFCC